MTTVRISFALFGLWSQFLSCSHRLLISIIWTIKHFYRDTAVSRHFSFSQFDFILLPGVFSLKKLHVTSILLQQRTYILMSLLYRTTHNRYIHSRETLKPHHHHILAIVLINHTATTDNVHFNMNRMMENCQSVEQSSEKIDHNASMQRRELSDLRPPFTRQPKAMPAVPQTRVSSRIIYICDHYYWAYTNDNAWRSSKKLTIEQETT